MLTPDQIGSGFVIIFTNQGLKISVLRANRHFPERLK